VVTGQVANELVLMLAELMDNATQLSDERALVHAQRLADRLVVQVIDTGIGIDHRRRTQLNQRLAAPVVDTDAVSHMGLTVVGLLAVHYGLRVELRPNQPRGVIAEVTVPEHLLRPGAPARATVDGRHAATEPPTVPVPDSALAKASTQAALSARIAGPAPSSLRARGAARAQLPTTVPVSSRARPRVADAQTSNGLPVRDPQATEFPELPTQARRPSAQRDPGQVAAALAAYARGVSQSRQQHRPPSTERGK
jgi:hypothetical protein